LFEESEEGLLYRDMENDLVQQIQRRLSTLRQL
jgi:outer membrane lipopolysaccharide assembly protein LptE/RlpB